MSIATILQSIRTNLSAAWTALINKGATIPANQNIENLATAITSIPSGGTNKLPSVVDRSVTEITAQDLGNITRIGEYAFDSCTSLINLGIPSSVRTIGQYAFSGCLSLTNIFIDDIVDYCKIECDIGFSSSPFTAAKNLYINNELVMDLVIPDSVTEIKPQSAFMGNPSFTSITIGNGVTTIGQSAFSGGFSTNMTLITLIIGNGVTTIGQSAFSGHGALTSIRISATTPPTLANANAFNNTNNCPIYAPYNSVNAYRTATNWASLSSRIQGFAPGGTFSQGDTLPTTSTEGLTLTWYSDVGRTQLVTTVSDPTVEYYCTAA